MRRLHDVPPAPPPPPAEPEVDLIAQIDSTARTLLRRIEGGVNMKADESAILSEQVKAFDAIVKWANVRKDLLPKDEKPKDTKFAGIKSAFRSGATPRNRGGPGGSAAGKDSAVSAASAPAGADDGDGDEE